MINLKVINCVKVANKQLRLMLVWFKTNLNSSCQHKSIKTARRTEHLQYKTHVYQNPKHLKRLGIIRGVIWMAWIQSAWFTRRVLCNCNCCRFSPCGVTRFRAEWFPAKSQTDDLGKLCFICQCPSRAP